MNPFLKQLKMKRSTVSSMSIVLLAFLFFAPVETKANTLSPPRGATHDAAQTADEKASHNKNSNDNKVDQASDEKASNQQAHRTTIGFPRLIYQHVIAGSKVVAKPITDDEPIVLRIVETYPHGSNFRYDIEYKGLDPGTYNLANFLTREIGEEPIPAIPVVIESLLGPGQVKPTDPLNVTSEFRSYYLPVLLVAAAGWLGGLLMILFYGRGKKLRPETHQAKITVADRMRPLIDAAVAGELSSKEQAELERVLSSFWSKKLRLGHLPADQLREHLRSHPDASVLLNQIDNWLHRPSTDPTNQVDISKILEPYQSVNYEEIQ
ncbi:MAG: hypothetical protein AB8B55_08680 [Mariniblastus sp.]